MENEVAVVKTPTIISNNPVYKKCLATTPMYIYGNISLNSF